MAHIELEITDLLYRESNSNGQVGELFKIDNCDFRSLSLRFTFLLISARLYKLSEFTIHQAKVRF